MFCSFRWLKVRIVCGFFGVLLVGEWVGGQCHTFLLTVGKDCVVHTVCQNPGQCSSDAIEATSQLSESTKFP